MTTPPPKSDCPLCGITLNAATGIKPDSRPKPGDLSVCMRCGTLLCWTSAWRLRRLRPAEQAALQRDDPETWVALLQARREVEAGTWVRRITPVQTWPLPRSILVCGGGAPVGPEGARWCG
jgi:hypothetical protein